MALTDKLTAIADAIRGKTGKADGLTLEQMATEIAGIQAGGGGLSEQERIDGLFSGAWPVGEIVLTEATAITERKLQGFTKITKVTGNKVTSISAYGLDSCTELEFVEFPELLTAGPYSFTKTKIKSVSFPKLKKLDYSVFNGQAVLESCYAPLCTSIGNSCFQNTAITEIHLPLLTGNLDNNTFNGCRKLVRADIGNCTRLGNSNTFGSTTSLKALIIRTPTVCTATGMYGNPMQSSKGNIYVPAALVEQYQVATNWSTLYASGNCAFLPLEEYTVDGTTTGAINWGKVEAEVASV